MSHHGGDYYTKLNFFKDLHRSISDSGLAPLPDRATLELTMRCNLKCYMCHRGKGIDELSTAELKKVINNLGGVSKLHLTGGEIFLRKDIFEILDCLKDREVSLNTNGTLLNEAKVARLLKYENITHIGFSIDGMGALHNKIRGIRNAFEKTVNAIKLLSGEFPVVVNTVVLKENVSKLDEILSLARRLSAEEFRAEMEMFCTPEDIEDTQSILGDGHSIAAQVKMKDAYEYPLEKFREMIANLKDLSSKMGISFDIGPKAADIDSTEFYKGDIREKRKLMCKHLLVARVDPAGNLVFCHSIKKGFGNLSQRPLTELWNGEDVMAFRRTLLQNNLFPVCKRCCRLRSIS